MAVFTFISKSLLVRINTCRKNRISVKTSTLPLIFYHLTLVVEISETAFTPAVYPVCSFADLSMQTAFYLAFIKCSAFELLVFHQNIIVNIKNGIEDINATVQTCSENIRFIITTGSSKKIVPNLPYSLVSGKLFFLIAMIVRICPTIIIAVSSVQ